MIRNIVIAAAATVLFAVAPVQAAPIYSSAPTIEIDSYTQDVSHWVKKCKIVRVKTYYGWKNVKKCKRVFLKHQSYGY
jgi:hypothetical protein